MYWVYNYGFVCRISERSSNRVLQVILFVCHVVVVVVGGDGGGGGLAEQVFWQKIIRSLLVDLGSRRNNLYLL